MPFVRRPFFITELRKRNARPERLGEQGQKNQQETDGSGHPQTSKRHLEDHAAPTTGPQSTRTLSVDARRWLPLGKLTPRHL